MAGVPVDVNVAAICGRSGPTLPTPDTDDASLGRRENLDARANAGPSVSARWLTAWARAQAPACRGRRAACRRVRLGSALRAFMHGGFPDAVPDSTAAPRCPPAGRGAAMFGPSDGARGADRGCSRGKSIATGGGSGIQQRRNEAAVASARAVPAVVRVLH